MLDLLIWETASPGTHKHKIVDESLHIIITLGRIAQSVMRLTADPGVASLIPALSHTLAEIDHEIISLAIPLPSADSRWVVVSYKPKYVHRALVNRLVKLAQEKVWLG